MPTQLQFSSWRSKGTASRQTDVELNALRCEIQQLEGCDNDALASLACLRRVQNETFDARIRKMQDWKEQQVLREEQMTRLQALVQVQQRRREQRSSARCPGSVPRTSSDHEECHGLRLYVCQAPNAFICVSGGAPPKHQMRLYVCHQMRFYVCHQMRLYVCHQMRLYVCHQMRLNGARSHVF